MKLFDDNSTPFVDICEVYYTGVCYPDICKYPDYPRKWAVRQKITKICKTCKSPEERVKQVIKCINQNIKSGNLKKNRKVCNFLF